MISELRQTLYDFQESVALWNRKNFPVKRPHQPLLGLAEEVGELAHAHLKMEQGIRGKREEHFKAEVDAVGDIMIFLADYCSNNHIDLGYAVELTWNKVKKRDWTKNKRTGAK